MIKRLYIILLFSTNLFAQTYIVKDQYGIDTGIRLEKESSPYLQGFEAGYGKPLDYNKKGNTIIINNYSAKSDNSITPLYSSSVRKGYSKRQLKRAQRWVKRKLGESKETKTPPKEKKVISRTKEKKAISRISEQDQQKIEEEFNFSQSDLTDFVLYCNMDDFLYSYPEFGDKHKILEINKGEIVRIVKGEIEFTFWQKVYFKENVGYVHKSFFNSQEPISNYQ